jgi:peptidyl-prolyl cis-trans isomerase A (cyclophilin A)
MNFAIRRLFNLILAATLILLPGTASADPANPAIVRVRLVTSEGPITLALDARRAPKTTANFMAYVDDGRLDGTTFYRAARRKSAPGLGYIQGGIRTDARRSLPPIPHEPTDQTGIRHLDGVISMARGGAPGSAMGNFFIMAGPNPALDAREGRPGYAAFGKVISGMDTVRRILAQPTGGGVGAMRGQMILRPIHIIRAERLNGTAKPTGRAKPWLIKLPDFSKR